MSAVDLAGLVVSELVACGVAAAVCCPGSRNAPLLLAFAEAAHSGALSLEMRLDERGAAFLALGIAKATARPVAVVTTSGTAVGNLLPAVMEAYHAGVPLVVVSADRPAAMRGTGANQTTNQEAIFGRFASTTVVTDADPDPRAAVRAALASTVGERPEPAQINLELADPLVGHPRLEHNAPRDAELRPDAVPEVLHPIPGTVVIAGDATPETGAAAFACAEQGRVPLLAEPSSNARLPGAVATGTLLLGSALGKEIRRVIVFGRPTLSRPQRRLLTDPAIDVVQVGPTEAPDRYPACRTAARAVTLLPDDGAWLERWRDADARVVAMLRGHSGAELTGWDLTSAVLEHLGPGDNVLWGSSSLLRDADLAPIAPRPPRCYANRGLAGIDGLISTAAGVALGSGRPTTAVLGDITALHDVNALVVPSAERIPDVRIVVGNDDGGSIFGTLEQGELPAPLLARLFALPHGRSLARAAEGLGIPATQVASRAELDAALAAPVRGLSVVEARISAERRGPQGELRKAVLAAIR